VTDGPAADPVTAMLAVVEQIQPAMSAGVILGALEQSAARPDGRRRIAAAVTGRPDLLTGQGAHAPFPAVLRFISALARAGATSVAEPCCPRCGRQRPLSGLAAGSGSAAGAAARPGHCPAAGAGR
jgi:hypothetical protein